MYGHTTLILLGAGPSSARLAGVLARHPAARIWTINAVRHPRAELQFEIHYPAPLNALAPDVPTILSPFARNPAPKDRCFPLHAACTLGAPFFELTHDYALAYAALLQDASLPPDAFPSTISPSPIDRVILCGVDLDDRHHFDQSRGAHFWIGVLRGMRIAVETMPEASILVRRAIPGRLEPSQSTPFFYGQPPCGPAGPQGASPAFSMLQRESERWEPIAP